MLNHSMTPKRLQLSLFYLFTCSLLLTITSMNSCKKNDTLSNSKEKSETEKFFNRYAPTIEAAKEISMTLQQQNAQTNFVSALPANSGYPVWDKIVRISKNNTLIVPLTLNNLNLTALLIIRNTDNGSIVRCLTKNYLFDVCHNPAYNKPKAEGKFGLFMVMENIAFGTSGFYHIPAHLFNEVTGLDNEGNKTINMVSAYSNSPTPDSYVEVCIKYKIKVECGGAQTPIPDASGGCYVEREICESIYFDDDPPPIGGGGGGGSGGGDPCPGNTWYNPVPNPCGDGDPPPPPIIDSTGNCDPFIDTLQKDNNFVSKFQYLNSKSVLGLSYEIGYEVRDRATQNYIQQIGSTSYPTILWNIPANTFQEGLIHSHYDGLNNIFTPEDVIFMAQVFLANHAKDTNNLYMGIASSLGLPYLIKVGDVAAYRTFCEKIAGVNGNDEKKQNTFAEKFYNKINSDNPDTNEREFLKLIKEYGADTGLILYQGNNDCNQWKKLKIDNFGAVIQTNCF